MSAELLLILSVLHSFVCRTVNAVQELMEELSRRMAAESQIAGITAERDAYRQECEVLELKLKSTQRELNSTHCQMEQNQGCMRQPQSLAPGTDDMPHGSDAAEASTGPDLSHQSSWK